MSPLTADQQLLARLAAEPQEQPWLEFKVGNAAPQEVGEYISALANAAVLDDRTHGYLVWGLRDTDHAVVGTSFDPWSAKGQGNEDLIPWLTRLLDPQVYFNFRKVITGGDAPAIILEVDAARAAPVAFRGTRYIRVGSYKKVLSGFPEHEARLWSAFRGVVFETGTALASLSDEQALELLDFPTYFELTGQRMPETRRAIADAFVSDGLLSRSAGTGTSITNLGALLFARDLEAFPTIARRAVRVVEYRGNSRAEPVREQRGERGYAAGFAGLLGYVSARLPRVELLENGLRREEPMYPDQVVRELAANMLIHQDFSLTGTGPMVEVFANRVEFTNPGLPIIDIRKFLGPRPPSRNEALASFMTRAHISEERGSGWEKIATQVELHQLPAPRITTDAEHTKVTLFARRTFAEMTANERVEAVYLHSALRFVSSETTTNSSVRARFGIAEGNSAQVSRVLADAVASGLLVIEDPNVGSKSRRYLPFWAGEANA